METPTPAGRAFNGNRENDHAPRSSTLASELDVLVVVGTRPEAIKLVPVILQLQESDAFHPVVISTGQHHLMVEEVMQLAGIEVDAVVCAGAGSGGLNELLPSVMRGFEDFCATTYGMSGSQLPTPDDLNPGSRPCVTLVHGDTTSALAAALASFHLRIPVAHVEAGLRTGGSIMEPFPEELNRQAIGRIASLHLAPTGKSAENLIREGVPLAQVLVTGNTAIDAFRWALGLDISYSDERVEAVHSADSRVVLVTAHRRESWGGGLARIADATLRLAERFPETKFIVCVHPNPIVQRELGQPLEGAANICATGPLPYLEFARLIERSHFVITDSGGIQEEAPSIGRPVLVTREMTERGEALAAGTVELVGTDPERIEAAAARLLTDPKAYAAAANAHNPYGDGHAAERIVTALAHIRGSSTAPAPFGPIYERGHVLEVAGYGSSFPARSGSERPPSAVAAVSGASPQA